MVDILESLMRLKSISNDAISEKIKKEFLKIAELHGAKIDFLDDRSVFEFEKRWKKRIKKPTKKRLRHKKGWVPINDSLWYHKEDRLYLFESRLCLRFTSKRKAINDGWRLLGLVTNRLTVRKFRYGRPRKGDVFFATKGKKELKYRAWQ